MKVKTFIRLLQANIQIIVDWIKFDVWKADRVTITRIVSKTALYGYYK